MTSYVSYVDLRTGSLKTLPKGSEVWSVAQVPGDTRASRLDAAIAYIHDRYEAEPSFSVPPGRDKSARLEFDVP